MINVLRTSLLVAIMSLLMMPRGIMSLLSVMILVIPVAYTGVRGQSRTFNTWAIYILAFFAFAYLRDVADALGFMFVRYPIVLDRVIGIGAVPTVWLQERFYTPGSAKWWDYAAISIHLSHFLTIPGLGLLLWRFRSGELRPVLFSMIGVMAGSVVAHVLIPTAPPWIAGQTGDLPTVYRVLQDVLGGLTPGLYQYGLSIAGGNDVAAMPSVHTAAVTMVALGAWQTRWFALGVTYAVLMGLSLVYLGEHYAVDVIAGALLAVSVWRWMRPRVVREEAAQPEKNLA